ncbi:MAG: XRE family transcriptional regulator [Nitriliruptoraceae bacterium]
MGLDWKRPDARVDASALRDRMASTVRDLRARDGRSLAELARAAGIGKSTLHAIESGQASPGIETLWALAGALDVPFGALLEPATSNVRVVRAGQGPLIGSDDDVLRARLLASTPSGARVEVYAVTIRDQGERDAEAHGAGTVEHVLVTSGRLRVGPVDGTVTLDPGDLASFAGDRAHRYAAVDGPAEAILLIEYA